MGYLFDPVIVGEKVDDIQCQFPEGGNSYHSRSFNP